MDVGVAEPLQQLNFRVESGYPRVVRLIILVRGHLVLLDDDHAVVVVFTFEQCALGGGEESADLAKETKFRQTEAPQSFFVASHLGEGVLKMVRFDM